MLVVDKAMRPYLRTIVKLARDMGKLRGQNGLIESLRYLHRYAGADRTVCRLFRDFAPLSFEFVMYRREEPGRDARIWFNGGLIFHGAPDGYGSGAAPTFSVTLTPTDGWSIHT